MWHVGPHRSLDTVADAIHSSADIFEGDYHSLRRNDVVLVTLLANLAWRKTIPPGKGSDSAKDFSIGSILAEFVPGAAGDLVTSVSTSATVEKASRPGTCTRRSCGWTKRKTLLCILNHEDRKFLKGNKLDALSLMKATGWQLIVAHLYDMLCRLIDIQCNSVRS